MKTMRQVEQIAGIAAVTLVFLGCFVVMRPFLSALLWAGILCFATWPCYAWLKRRVRGRSTLAATLMVLLIALVMVLPFVFVGMTFAENVAQIVRAVQRVQEQGLPAPPAWVRNVPLAGAYLDEYWREVGASTEKTGAFFKLVFARMHPWMLRHGLDLGEGILQLTLSVVLVFFFFRSGERLSALLSEGVERLIGESTQRFLRVVADTIQGVVYGFLGTALAQGIVAGIGFLIAGVPLALLWALLVFFLALLPFGPPVVWVPVAVWLYLTGHSGWAVFMALWGTLVISGIDNFLRPYIISRGSPLPFVLIFLGVLGGILAFGFIGIFLGPTLLAAGYCLAGELLASRVGAPAAGTPAQPEV